MAFLPSAFKYPVFQSVVLNAGYFFLSACLQPIQKVSLVEFALSLFVYRGFPAKLFPSYPSDTVGSL